MVAIGEPLDDFGRGLLAGEIEEELLDVLNLECTLLQGILFNEVFHGFITIRRYSCNCVASSGGAPAAACCVTMSRRSRSGCRGKAAPNVSPPAMQIAPPSAT